MVKFCISCGTANTPDARFCAKCGNAIQPAGPSYSSADPETVLTITPESSDTSEPDKAEFTPIAPASTIQEFTDPDAAKPRSSLMLIGAVIGAILLIGLLYFWLFVMDDISQSGAESENDAAAEVVEQAPQAQMFTMTEANIRDKATTVDSTILGKLPRGSAITGVVKTGEDGTSEWLELSEGKGFVAATNLSEIEPPVLTKLLNDKIWAADDTFEIWSQPDSASALVDRVSEGSKLTLVGLTTNDYIEIKLKKGGVGYIADGAAIIARANGKPIAISFNPGTCRFGSEIDALFEKMGAKLRAQWIELEAREFPSEEAREKAMGAIEGRSSYERLQRTYEGLTLTAIAQHYESQSIYFADPASKVIEVFREKGFRIGRDGAFPSTELYAGISGTRGEGSAYGKSELGCGV